MQVYVGMDIGTAKPDSETRRRFDYRMLDVCEPSENMSVQRFQDLARGHVAEIMSEGKRVVISGGSGLHFRAVVDPMTFAPTDPDVREQLESMDGEELRSLLLAADPTAGDHVDVANPRRVVRAVEVWRLTGQTPSYRAMTREAAAVRRYEPLVPFKGFGVDAGTMLAGRAANRLHTMVEGGFVDEVEGLRGRLGTNAAQAVGYMEFLRAVDGEISMDDAFNGAIRSTKRLVKAQRTFFRRDPRIVWLTWQDDEAVRIQSAVERIGEVMQWTS